MVAQEREKTLTDRINEWWNKPSPSEVAGWDLTSKDPWKNDTNAFLATEYEKRIAEGQKKVAVSSKPKTKHSRIRVQLSRPLRTAEIEKLYTDHHTVGARLNVARDINGFLFKLRVSPNGTHIWVDADTPSRLLYEVVAAALDQHFVNVYPTAVRTFTEYNGE